MSYLIILILAIVMLVWYIRPLYNFFAKRKYALLNQGSISFSKRVQSGLPAVIFYTLLVGAIIYPAFTTNLVGKFESGTLVVGELMIIFFLSRYDKWQTKYKIDNTGVHFRRKSISWTEKYSIKYKKTIFIVLHKPRFIISSKGRKIVVPVLSSNIGSFVKHVKSSNKSDGYIVEAIYENIKNYYITNNTLAKHINKK